MRATRSVSTNAFPAQNTELPAVLVVDDVRANTLALEAVLQSIGCEIWSVRSGQDALRALLKRDFAVMLLDVQMPEMDGYEVAAYARKNPATRDVPIIFLTATSDSESTALRGYGSGAVDFLFKPLNPLILKSKVGIFLELWAAKRAALDAQEVLVRRNSELSELAEKRAALADEFARANVQLQAAYRDLQATQAQLIQSAKMASLGELVAGVAHEINNPLSFALSHLATVQRSLSVVGGEIGTQLSNDAAPHWARAEKRLSEMRLGLERIGELVVQLRTFSRKDEGELKKVSASESVRSVLTILAHRLKRDIEVVTHFAEVDVIECYPRLLNQALMNLVANSIDALGDAGRIEIRTSCDGESFRIEVSDDGTGISESIRERVFEPFFTTKPVGKGTGLGLAITFSIVEQHQGTLTLRERPGGGTVATMELPLATTGRAR